MLVRRLCSKRSLVGNQFIFLNYAVPICSLFPMPRQNLIHLFWDVCSFFLSFLFKFVYQARFAKSKWGWIRALHSIRLNVGVKKLCLRYKNLSLPLIFPKACVAIAAPDRFLSRVQPRYTTWACCFIFVSPLLMPISLRSLGFLFVQ